MDDDARVAAFGSASASGRRESDEREKKALLRYRVVAGFVVSLFSSV